MDAILQLFDRAYTDIVSGNVYAIILFTILCIAIAWKTSENSVRSFVKFIKNLFIKEKPHTDSLLIMSLLKSEVVTANDVQYSADLGRHLLYRYIVTTVFKNMEKKIDGFYNQYFTDKISPATFCNTDTHKQLLIEARDQARKEIEERLSQEGWTREKMAFLLDKIHIWMGNHCRLFNKYIVASTTPRTFLQNWLWICGEIVIEGEHFDIQFDGELVGQKFDGITIYEPDEK